MFYQSEARLAPINRLEPKIGSAKSPRIVEIVCRLADTVCEPHKMKVEPSDDVIFQPLKDEIILLNMKTQKYFGLDDVGSDIWRLLVECGDLETVADRMIAEYDADRDTIRKDLGILIDRLLEAGLLKTVESAGSVSG